MKVSRDALIDLLEDHFAVARGMISALSRGMLALMEATADARSADEAA